MMKLPRNWKTTTIGDACDVILGQSPPSDTYNEEGYGLPFYQGKTEFGYLFPTPAKWCSAPHKIAEANDILISVRAPVGPTNICPERSCIGRGLAALRPLNGTNYKYVLYFLRFIEKEWDSKATGTTFKAISGDILRRQPIPLPLPEEQDRIVERIESLFSQLDAGVAALKRAQANLKRYKAAVLKAACEGRLVPQDPNDEPAEEMLKRLHPGWAALSPTDLPELPQGWCWARMEHLGNHRLGKMLDKEKNIGTPRPYLRNANVRWFNFDLHDLLQIKVTDEELNSVSILPGDLVVCEGGEPGRSAVWDKEEPIVFQKALHRLRPHVGILAKYLNLHLAADASRGRLEKHFTGSTIKHFTGEAFRSYITAIPPTPEQVRIVNEMDRQFSIIQEMETAISANLSRAARLRQSILKLAFEGRLVEQEGEVEEKIAQISSAAGWKQEKLEIE